MQPRELPNLTVGNRPTMGPTPSASLGQRTARWLLAGTLGLVVAAGVTASFMSQPTDNKKKTTNTPAAATQRGIPDFELTSRTDNKPAIRRLTATP